MHSVAARKDRCSVLSPSWFTKAVCILWVSCGALWSQSSGGNLAVQEMVGSTNTSPHVRHVSKGRILWWISVPVLVAASALDAHSSWGKPEANPLLRGSGGRFDGKSLSIKLGISAGILGGEYIMARRLKRDERLENAGFLTSGASNMVGAAVLAVTAQTNYRRLPH
jgi:hypothetical protein